MDIINKLLQTFHLPSFGDVAASASQAAGKAATQAVVQKASQISVPGLGAFHMPSLTSGELFGILVVVGVLLLALTLGRTRTLVSTLSIYVAFALQAIFPFYAWLLAHASFTNDLPTLRVVVFLVLYALVFGLLNRSILKTRFHLGEASFIAVVAMGIAQLGFIVSIILNLAPKFYDITKRVPSGFLPYLATPTALFCWAVVPIILVIFAKRHYND
jgi:hypothetical protein